MHYAIIESRKRLEEFLIFFNTNSNILPKAESIINTLMKVNSNISKSIKEYSIIYKKKNKPIIESNIENKMNSNENIPPNKNQKPMSRGEKVLKMLETELGENVNSKKHTTGGISLAKMITSNQKEPSQTLLDSYTKKKQEVKTYINNLEKDYKEIEAIKHIRRCFLLRYIILIQRVFRRHSKIHKDKSAIKIQRKCINWIKRKNRFKELLNKLKYIIPG